MTETQIEVPYNHDLKPLEDVLTRVRRPGDFFVQGSLEAPMPRIDVDGVGVLSFPVPAVQARAIIAQCERAPYGRGSETLLDTSVRKVWQLAPSKIAIGGKSWLRTFEQILSIVADGLGCNSDHVSAEIYKLLVYDEGAFFKAHRDTEKVDGMFATLLVVLPSAHAGGDLVIRHAGREVTLDLSGGEVSELRLAAFYADCEHEVLPVTEGNRVCLVYNLLQQRRRKEKNQRLLVAPMYDAETDAAAELLGKTFAREDAPAKIAWLLEHQYSPAGLSFAGLKNADAALAKVLREAARRADCALHLGIVHIEEYGSAEYLGGFYGPRGWGDDYGDEDAGSDDFEIVEVTDGWFYIDHWLNVDDSAVRFGKLPLGEGEVLPAGALDDEVPDEQRVMEASGNEGASFERAYHRAALVIWPRAQFVDVLLQAGVHATLPYLEERAASCSEATAPDAERSTVLAEARKVVDAWAASEGQASAYNGGFGSADDDWTNEIDAEAYSMVPGESDAPADRARMLVLLGRLAAVELIERFVRDVVTPHFDGSEAAALVEVASVLGATRSRELLSRLVQQSMRTAPRGCVSFFAWLIHEQRAREHPDWIAVLCDIGAAIVEGLPALGGRAAGAEHGCLGRAGKAGRADADMLADLLDALAKLEVPALRDAACTAVVANGKAFDARAVIVPALQTLRERGSGPVIGDAEGERLWLHAADSLLADSEYPPAPPEDWRQDLEISCNCADCLELQAFAVDPIEQTHRFRVRKDRRMHLHRQIEKHRLDMTHLTERKGSPQTLICNKTRRSYERRRKSYRQDVRALAALARLVKKASGEFAARCARIADARERAAANSN